MAWYVECVRFTGVSSHRSSLDSSPAVPSRTNGKRPSTLRLLSFFPMAMASAIPFTATSSMVPKLPSFPAVPLTSCRLGSSSSSSRSRSSLLSQGSEHRGRLQRLRTLEADPSRSRTLFQITRRRRTRHRYYRCSTRLSSLRFQQSLRESSGRLCTLAFDRLDRCKGRSA